MIKKADVKYVVEQKLLENTDWYNGVCKHESLDKKFWIELKNLGTLDEGGGVHASKQEVFRMRMRGYGSETDRRTKVIDLGLVNSNGVVYYLWALSEYNDFQSIFPDLFKIKVG